MKFYKLIALVLAIATLMSVFVACDNDNASNGGDETQNNDNNMELTPSTVEKNNYGEDFFLSILDDVNPPKYYWVEETENDAMSEAVYGRQERVRKYLGVEIQAVGIGLNHDNYIEPFKTAVKNKDGSVDTLITHVSTGVCSLVSESYLRDFNDMPGINLDADYWNKDFMDSLAIADRNYLGFSNFNILYTHVVAFNKEMMDQYADNLEKSVYDLVEDYEWTLDKMISLAELVAIDRTGDGKTDDDTFGITGNQWVPWIGFLQASNINMVEMDQSGTYKISLLNEMNQEKTSQLVDKLKALSSSNYAYFQFRTTASPKVPLTSGRALMQLSATYDLVGYLDSDITFGVLPYPMWDEAQKNVGYRSLQWGGYLCIPNYLGNETMVGETLEVLSFYSDDVMITFYEKMLGKQVADVPEDRAMLDIVWESVCTDFGQTFTDECGTLYTLAYVTWPGDEGKELVSYVKGFENSRNKGIRKFITIVATPAPLQ